MRTAFSIAPALFMALLMTAPAAAQDLTGREIVVTGSRIDQDDYSDYQPAVGLRRKADFLVQEVAIRGDTRDPKQRSQEILAMIRGAIERASRSPIELATGNYILTELTFDNYEDIDIRNDRRPDTGRVDFLVKAPLANQTYAQAQAAIRDFIEAVPEVGRAQMDATNDATLSVIGPDSYRDAIIVEIGQDAKRQAATLGDDFTVELSGLNMPVQWSRAGPGEVLLFIPYELKIVPVD